jgi:GntR family transcriptional regulator
MRPTPEYQRIANDLKARIVTGELSAGARLPTVKQLQEQYGASAQAVKSALLVLQTEGLATFGMFAASRRPVSSPPATRRRSCPYGRRRGHSGNRPARPRGRRRP